MNLKNLAKKGTALALTALLMTGCGMNPNAAVVNINSGADTVKLGYANFVAHYNQAGYDAYYRTYYGDSYWTQDLYSSGSTMQDTVKEQVMADLEEFYVTNAHATEYGVAITTEDQEAITAAAKKFMDDNSDEAIKQIGATQEYVEEFLKDQTIMRRVQKAIEDSADVTVADEEAARTTIAYTYFETTEFDSQNIQVDKSEADIAEAKAHAESLAKADGDFQEDVEAEGGEYKTYSFKRNEKPEDETSMDSSIIAAAQKLKNGERSGVIEVENDGFYVVYMVDEYDKEASANKKKELEQQQKSEAYTEQLDAWKEEVTWEINEKEWEKVKFVEMFEIKDVSEESEEAAESEETVETEETEEAE